MSVVDRFEELTEEQEEQVRAELAREGFDHDGDYDLLIMWAKNCGLDATMHVQDFIEAYEGEYESEAAWAEQSFTDCYKTELDNLPGTLIYAIDWKVVARECRTAGDVYFLDTAFGVAVFRNI